MIDNFELIKSLLIFQRNNLVQILKEEKVYEN